MRGQGRIDRALPAEDEVAGRHRIAVRPLRVAQLERVDGEIGIGRVALGGAGNRVALGVFVVEAFEEAARRRRTYRRLRRSAGSSALMLSSTRYLKTCSAASLVPGGHLGGISGRKRSAAHQGSGNCAPPKWCGVSLSSHLLVMTFPDSPGVQCPGHFFWAGGFYPPVKISRTVYGKSVH